MDILEQYTENEGQISNKNCVQSSKGETIKIKLEDVDIEEEFIDGNEVHNRKTYVKTESDDLIMEEGGKPISVKIEENYQLKVNKLNTSEIESHDLKTSSSNNNEFLTCHYELDVRNKNKEFNDAQKKQHECHLCDFVTTHKKNIKRHVNSVHLDSKRHKCHLCDYASYRKSTVKFHIDTFHLNESKRHKCHLCAYAASLKIHLKVHVDSVHLKCKGNQCHLCDHKANRKSDLRRHIDTVHLKTKQFKCHLCNFVTSYKKNVDRHMVSVHSK